MAADVQSSEALAKHLIQIGAASSKQISDAKLALEAATLAGRQVTLGEILVEHGVLTTAMLANLEKKAIQRAGLRQLGPYKIVSKLGEGGMGTVYLAEDTHAQRPVALKVLARKLASQEIFLKRFRREAIATGKLNHVNIVSAYACDEESGYHYYAMEYCDGDPLDKTLKKVGHFAPELALDIITQVVRGLQHAHHNHIIHRDIKPANIFITKDNVAKILDLGLSKTLTDSAQSHMTIEGTTVGTPHYVSPEQARGEQDIDGRSDIYSLGATFYMLLTGETPFKGPSPAVIMTKHLTDPVPDPRNVRPSTPAPIAEIIQKMMAKDKADRYQSCDDVLMDLELVAAGKAPLLGVNADDEGPKPETGRHGRISGKSRRITGKQAPVEAPAEPLITSEQSGSSPGASGSRRVSKELKASTRESSRVRKVVDADANSPAETAKADTSGTAQPGAAQTADAVPSRSSFRTLAQAPEAATTKGTTRTAAYVPVTGESAPETAPEGPAKPQGGVPKGMILAGVALLIAGIAVGTMLNGGNRDQNKTAQNAQDGKNDNTKKSPPPPVPNDTPKPIEPPPNDQPHPTDQPKQKPPELPEPAKPVEPAKPTDNVKVSPPEPVKTPEKPEKTPEKTPPPEPVKPAPLAPVIVKELVVDLPLPKELLPRPPADPGFTHAPTTLAAEDPALESDAVRSFDRIAFSLKRGQFAPAKEMLDDIQKRLTATHWYAQNRPLLEAAYLQLEWAAQPWGKHFAAPAHPLTDPPGDRWDWRYNLLTTLPFERKEWVVAGNAGLNWTVGAWNFEHSGSDYAALVDTLPIAELERLEVTIAQKQGTSYGWALYSGPRAASPFVICWVDEEGKVSMGDEKKTALKLRAPSGGAPHKMIVYFRKNRAWMELGNQREELVIPNSPQWMLPALLVRNGSLRATDIRVEGALDAGYVKRIEDENERVKKLRQGGQEHFQLKVSVSTEGPSAAYAGIARGNPDSKGNYQAHEYSFTVYRGSIISVLQFAQGANMPGPVMVNLTLPDGRQTGTGLNPHFWTASGELGNWKGDGTVMPGWLPLPMEETKPKQDAAQSKAKYVLPNNRGLLLHYVFDPDDFK